MALRIKHQVLASYRSGGKIGFLDIIPAPEPSVTFHSTKG